MKENAYDNPVFFEKYSRMARSQLGLAGAGEWPALQPMLPPFEGRRVLDLGCGYGWHCMYAADHGAASVLGLDISERMLAVAREKRGPRAIAYRRCAIEDACFPAGSFDIVLSSLAFHYVQDWPGLVQNISRWLCPGGWLVFSTEHPVFTAEGSQQWVYGEDGRILHFPVDHYYEEGPRTAVFLGEKVTKYHRTLTTYLQALWENGFDVCSVREPAPPAAMLDIPGMRDELRHPMMLLVKALRR